MLDPGWESERVGSPIGEHVTWELPPLGSVLTVL